MFAFFAKRAGARQTGASKEWIGKIEGASAISRRRDLHGQTLRFPCGELLTEDNSGGLVKRDRHGNIVKTVNRDGAETAFEYNAANTLTAVIMQSAAAYVRLETGAWAQVGRHGKLEPVPFQFRLLADGTLRIGGLAGKDNGYYQDFRLDCSTARANEKGRITALRADLEVQQQRLYVILDNMRREELINSDQRQSLCDAMHSLSRRVGMSEITASEAAKTVYHICRLLESGGASPLGAQQCFLLAHELLFFAACPEFADNSDALSNLILQIFKYHPSQAAMLVAEMSIYKRYVTTSGWTIKYVEELMDPHLRRRAEWVSTKDDQRRFVESNRFLRVVLVNIVERARLAEKTNNVALLAERRRMFSTREFGRVFEKDMSRLWEEVTGAQPAGIDFSSSKKPTEGIGKITATNLAKLSQSGGQLPRALA